MTPGRQSDQAGHYRIPAAFPGGSLAANLRSRRRLVDTISGRINAERRQGIDDHPFQEYPVGAARVQPAEPYSDSAVAR